MGFIFGGALLFPAARILMPNSIRAKSTLILINLYSQFSSAKVNIRYLITFIYKIQFN